MKFSRAKKKYLQRNAFQPDFLVDENYEFYIVIPVRREKEYFPETLASIQASASFLEKEKGETVAIVVVLNGLESDFEDALNESYAENEFILEHCDGFKNIFVLDRFRSNWLTKGVGEARKVGMDHVVAWSGKHDPWIVSLDADTTLDLHFFCALSAIQARVGLAGISHRLSKDPKTAEAMREYENWLHYFAEGLVTASSPYAYIPLGSRFSCRVSVYVEAGGMVKRKAGEDFHFLQKLTKVMLPHPFEILNANVYPAGRLSDRVPWGTGPAIFGILGNEKKYSQVEPAEAFLILGDFIRSFAELYAQDLVFEVRLMEFLNHDKFKDVVKRLRSNSTTEKHFVRQMHVWFDGTRSIRWINYLTREIGREKIEVAQLHLTRNR